ncbi:hypothetical protein [Nocardia fluminea]|uniref:hypothetical protein n=1 Tax=Nocardia fluminea TaxID=134984 RepID=UPI003D1319FF
MTTYSTHTDATLAALTARAHSGRLTRTELTPEELAIAEANSLPVYEPDPTPIEAAAARVDALESAIMAGEPVTGADLAAARAAAQAEAEVVELAARGERERAKAAKELAKRQEAAKATVRKNLPVLPADELAALVQAARDALAAIVDASRAHVATIQEAKQVLTDGGVIERDTSTGNTPEEQAAMDWDNHGLRHAPGVVIDGATYSPGAYSNALVELGRHALNLGGAGHRFKFGL